MRRATGAHPLVFPDESLYEALLEPGQPVRSCCNSVQEMVELLGDDRVVGLLRASLPAPHVAACCTANDLLTAAKSPQNALIISGMCQMRVYYRQPLAEDAAFSFTPTVLNRRIAADLCPVM